MDTRIEPISYEHETVEPLRVENDNAGEAYCKGYSDAYQDKPLNVPRKHQTSYMRGYICGLRARYGEH